MILYLVTKKNAFLWTSFRFRFSAVVDGSIKKQLYDMSKICKYKSLRFIISTYISRKVIDTAETWKCYLHWWTSLNICLIQYYKILKEEKKQVLVPERELIKMPGIWTVNIVLDAMRYSTCLLASGKLEICCFRSEYFELENLGPFLEHLPASCPMDRILRQFGIGVAT